MGASAWELFPPVGMTVARLVHEMWANYQNQVKVGGEGYLRIIEFLPDGKMVHVQSYSPLLDIYLQDAGNQFKLRT